MPDNRGSIKIDISLFKGWIETHYTVYARDTVKIDGEQLPLICSCSMNKNYIVSLDKDILYTGEDMVEAIRVFNLDIRRLYDLWVNINTDSKNKVVIPNVQKRNPLDGHSQ